MDRRHPVPGHVTPAASITLTGIVKAKGRSEFAPLTRCKICRIEVEMGKLDITVMAYGDAADQLAEIGTGTPVRIEGRIDLVQWDTGDGQIHQRMGVRAEQINVAT